MSTPTRKYTNHERAVKGGLARNLNLSARKRKQLARHAANVRWARARGEAPPVPPFQKSAA